jgi:molecular chaperone DnaK (HSP70)
MTIEPIVGADLGTTNSLVGSMRTETCALPQDEGSAIEERIAILEVLTKIDGREAAPWEERDPIKRDVDRELRKLDRDINACRDPDHEAAMWERRDRLARQLERANIL